MDKTIVFKVETPTKNTASQKGISELFKTSSSVAHLTVLSIEALYLCNKEDVDVSSDKASDKKFLPDPAHDPCIGIFFTLYKDVCINFQKPDDAGGCVVKDFPFNKNEFPYLKSVPNESSLFWWLGRLLRQEDPDIIVG